MLDVMIPTQIQPPENTDPVVTVRFYNSEATASGYETVRGLDAIPTAASYTPHPVEHLIETAASHLQNLGQALPAIDEEREEFVDQLIGEFYAQSELTPLG